MNAAVLSEATSGDGLLSLKYQHGFGNQFATEALSRPLPEHNSPQRSTRSRYRAQAPRAANRRTWLYRMRPAAVHRPFRRLASRSFSSGFGETEASPNQLRWDPLPIPSAPTDFFEGVITLAGNADPYTQECCGSHLYAATRSMTARAL